MDTYATIALIARTPQFQERIIACAAQQGAADPALWASQRRYQIAASPSWAEKVDYWLAANPGAEDPAGWAEDQGVISDGDILAAVQPKVLAG